jgi:hypothetical protein
LSIDFVKTHDFVKPGARVIITGGFPIGTPTNSFRILDIE